MANKIIKTTLHPDLSPQDTDLYPKTSVDMVEGLDTELNNLETKINDIGAPITPFFYNDKLNNNGAINSNLLIPQRELYEGAKIIDQSAQMFQATLNDGNYVANQLTFAEQYNADINNAITEVQNNLTNESQDLEAKIAEVGADYKLADEQVLADAKAYTDSHSGGTKKYAHLLYFSSPSYTISILVFSTVSTPFMSLTEILASMSAGERYMASGSLYGTNAGYIGIFSHAEPRLPSSGAPALIAYYLSNSGNTNTIILDTNFRLDKITEL